MTKRPSTARFRIVAFSGNTHRPSKSRALAGAIAEAVAARQPVDVQLLDILDGGPDLGLAYAPQDLGPRGIALVRAIEEADALIVASPVYKGSYAGLFKHVFDLVDPAALADRPVIVAATGGGHRHALVVEHQLRPLFGFFGALTVPTSVYASDGEFRDGRPSDPGLEARIASASGQLVAALSPRTPRTLVADAA
ncbi:NADH-dependent FMN reductase SfnF [Methylobacterium crusticola]|uniref:NADH-dependent FMN reductase SfnF n=1 Tax=Methylobacterium crusticola TaxID=1697972 RepID=A0ABQ4QSN5_9HYPH|nr:FMN reductase [Methylobacterium crusticola]GJD48338.1 NADH-dependent FMN reductase SfnF [Methylobacterium crusticola]